VPREIFSAKAREDDGLAVQHAQLSFNTSPKFLRVGLSRYGRLTVARAIEVNSP
jgi:hypothetical protein